MNQEVGPKTLCELRKYIRQDVDFTSEKPQSLLKRYLIEAGAKYTFWLRVTRYLFLKGKFAFLPFLAARSVLKHYGYKYSFDISYRAQIGGGLQIAHYGYIIVPASTTMGEYCRLRPGVVIGTKFTRNEKHGVIIGDGVEFGVGAKVLGDITIGDNVIIGANAVVLENVPDNCIVAGVPAKITKTFKDVSNVTKMR